MDKIRARSVGRVTQWSVPAWHTQPARGRAMHTAVSRRSAAREKGVECGFSSRREDRCAGVAGCGGMESQNGSGVEPDATSHSMSARARSARCGDLARRGRHVWVQLRSVACGRCSGKRGCSGVCSGKASRISGDRMAGSPTQKCGP
eukprot:6183569-Pleurochrysis_carterae.AAC.2